MNPVIEPLEPRLLLSSAVIHDKKLIVRGDLASPNTITVSLDVTKTLILVDLNGTPLSFHKSKVERVQIIGGDLNDTLAVDESIVKFTIATLFLGRAGDDTIIGGTE